MGIFKGRYQSKDFIIEALIIGILWLMAMCLIFFSISIFYFISYNRQELALFMLGEDVETRTFGCSTRNSTYIKIVGRVRLN